ncbi:hypothetical protein BDZ89DRAFT_1066111 [Hymenopellis radicata]|nr:hypothetical protein BDZ89DRAFT_1066111 [Hymenopellis radicata]
MVNTDAANFTVFLTNEDRSVMPTNNLELAALVVGSDGNTTLNPPSAGWPKGGGFRVNLCRDPQSPTTILAQSDQFNITSSTSTSATSSGSKTLNTHTGTTFIATGTSGSVDSSSTSTDNLSPVSTSNAAMPGVVAQGGLMGALAVIGALLA